MKAEELATILADHKAFLNGEGRAKADFFWANLEQADLRGINLDGVDFEGANLFGANLAWTNLHNINLCSARLWGVNVFGATGILSIGPIDSHKDNLYVVQHAVTRMYKTAYFWGDEATFLADFIEKHSNKIIALAYRAAVEMARILLPVEGETDAC